MGERPPCTQNMRLSMSADRLQHSTMHRVSLLFTFTLAHIVRRGIGNI